jgi:phage FluMu protein Com
MNLRCSYCQTPFTIGRNEKLIALQMMQAEDLHHYDAHCPRCRRANQVPRDRLELSFPGWQEALAAITNAPAPRAVAVQSKPAAKPDKKPAAKAKPVTAAVKGKQAAP